MLWDTDMLDELLTAGLERVRREFERIRPSDHGASCRQVGVSEGRRVGGQYCCTLLPSRLVLCWAQGSRWWQGASHDA